MEPGVVSIAVMTPFYHQSPGDVYSAVVTASTLAHASRIWIALAHHPIIHRFVTLRRARLFQFALSRSIGPLSKPRLKAAQL